MTVLKNSDDLVTCSLVFPLSVSFINFYFFILEKIGFSSGFRDSGWEFDLRVVVIHVQNSLFDDGFQLIGDFRDMGEGSSYTGSLEIQFLCEQGVHRTTFAVDFTAELPRFITQKFFFQGVDLGVEGCSEDLFGFFFTDFAFVGVFKEAGVLHVFRLRSDGLTPHTHVFIDFHSRVVCGIVSPE